MYSMWLYKQLTNCVIKTTDLLHLQLLQKKFTLIHLFIYIKEVLARNATISVTGFILSCENI